MLEVAKEYAAKGWHVFPIHGVKEDRQCTCGRLACTDTGKHPTTENGLKNASCDIEIVTRMFTEAPAGCNIGIVTGKISGLTIIDVDVGPNKMGAETWAALIEEKGEPNTLMVRTGSGGMHVYFKYNSALKTGTNRLGKGVDIRCDGGYVVAPPSLHRCGDTYRWLNEGTQTDDVPEHLLQAKQDGRKGKRTNDPTKRKYSLKEASAMLASVDNTDRDTWRNIGIILGREYERSDAAWGVYVEWAEIGAAPKGRNHDEIMREAFYEISQDRSSGKTLSLGSIVHLAVKGGWTPKNGAVPIQNFIYFAPGNNFVYRPTASFWIKEAVDCAVGKVNKDGMLMPASDYLKEAMLATSMTKSPALAGDFIRGFDCREGELIAEAGSAVFNSYRRPTIELGDAALATPFTDHVKRVFANGTDAEQFLDYMAHRVQVPEEKPRFALLIAGDQGVGKDTAVEFCIPSIGAWNVANVEPAVLDSGFNEYAAATLVRVSEAANLHDMSKWAFNERMKVIIAGSPDHASINPKYGQKYSVKLCCGVIVTTNHLMTGIYLPPDDRRYDVIEASSKKQMGLNSDADVKGYFTTLWEWFNEGGDTHVAAFLNQRDISKFSASNGQRKTAAHKEVVSSSFSSDHWLLDALDSLGDPEVVRSDAIIEYLTRGGSHEKEYSSKLTPSLTRQGYSVVRNQTRKDGRWKYGDKLALVFAKRDVEDLDAKVKALKVPF